MLVNDDAALRSFCARLLGRSAPGAGCSRGWRVPGAEIWTNG